MCLKNYDRLFEYELSDKWVFSLSHSRNFRLSMCLKNYDRLFEYELSDKWVFSLSHFRNFRLSMFIG